MSPICKIPDAFHDSVHKLDPVTTDTLVCYCIATVEKMAVLRARKVANIYLMYHVYVIMYVGRPLKDLFIIAVWSLSDSPPPSMGLHCIHTR